MARILAAMFGVFVCQPSMAAENELVGFTGGHVSFSGGPRVMLLDSDLALGLGVQMGYTLPVGIYFGGVTDLFLLSERDRRGGVQVNNRVQILHVLGEGGFDFGLGDDFVLRPTVGFGLTNVDASGCAAAPLVGSLCGGESVTEVTLMTGGQALYRISRLTIGGEVRATIGPVDALFTGFNIGFAFGPS